MIKEKTYPDVKFSPEVIRKAIELFDSYLTEEQQKFISTLTRSIMRGTEEWSYDTDEEFFADFREDHDTSYYHKNPVGFSIEVRKNQRNMTVRVRGFDTRQKIQAIFDVFEANVDTCKLPPLPSPKPHIFIGHGGSQQWTELKGFLQDRMGYDVLAYEIGARAGHTIRDILEEILEKASFAILVMTGEDQGADGKMRARQNVIHELGLFQGRLGFPRAIVLLEESTEEFSNIHGVHQVRYSKGNIKETFGEVLATLRREFDEVQRE